MIECIFTKEKHWLTKWDHYLQTNDRGSHLILSDWLKSYAAYNFDFEVCIVLHKDEIVGGFGAVIAKVLFLKFYVIPFGPIVSVGFEKELNSLIQQVVSRATFHNSCYCHVTLPFGILRNNHVFNGVTELESLKSGAKGHLFNHVYSSNGLNWIALDDSTDVNCLLNKFKTNTRRDIRSSSKKNLILKSVRLEDEIFKAYQLCLKNASERNYSVRSWESFKATLLSIIEKEYAEFIVAYHNGIMKGAILLIKSGNFYTYVIGATKKEKPDLLIGHFLQWEAIKLSYDRGFDGYNISFGGSKGVADFKNGFNPEHLEFKQSKHHWILKPVLFKIYLFFAKYLKAHKKRIAYLLSMIKKVL